MKNYYKIRHSKSGFTVEFFRTQTKVEFGFEDYFLEVQQFVTIEILNHEDEKVRLAKIEQLYGPC